MNLSSVPKFNLKLGSMKRAQEFILYPFNKDSESWVLQADNYIVRVYPTGDAMLSARQAHHASFAHLNPVMGAKPIKVDSEILDKLKSTQGFKTVTL